VSLYLAGSNDVHNEGKQQALFMTSLSKDFWHHKAKERQMLSEYFSALLEILQ
jgi:hypothetical protein